MIEVRNLDKTFPGVLALRRVNLRVDAGEVLAVIGENGAGKSTLMKILAGIQLPDAGQIAVDGRAVQITSVRAAQQLGIALIHQELNLCDNLSVGANIFLGREPAIGPWGRRDFRGHSLVGVGRVVDSGRIRGESRELLQRIGLAVDPDTLVGNLSIGQQQMVEIAKALAARARVLIMDEPTSSLSQHEAERLFSVINDLRRDGVSVIYISHRLGEVKAVADRVVVLRDGENAGELQRDEIDHETMVRMMVGRDIQQLYQHRPRPAGDVVLQVRGLRTLAYPDASIDLEVRAGEIVALAGLVGAGRSELLRALFGVDDSLAGSIQIDGVELRSRGVRHAIASGVMLAPEDRKKSGLIIDQSVVDNMRLARVHRESGRLGFVRPDAFDVEANELVRRLGIRTPDLHQIVRLLSGGNQQKVVLGKWLSMRPRVFLLDEPTRGIDVGAKAEIYQLMDELAGVDVAVVFASSEMEEVLGMADRVLVMHDGRITGELARDQLSEEAIMRLATEDAVA